MAELKKLHIQVGKKEMVLSPEEAKELKAVLEELFGKDVEHHYHTKEVVRDKYPWTYWGLRYSDSGTTYLSATKNADFSQGLSQKLLEQG